MYTIQHTKIFVFKLKINFTVNHIPFFHCTFTTHRFLMLLLEKNILCCLFFFCVIHEGVMILCVNLPMVPSCVLDCLFYLPAFLVKSKKLSNGMLCTRDCWVRVICMYYTPLKIRDLCFLGTRMEFFSFFSK